MSKFKVGDRVRRVSDPQSGAPIGYETSVTKIDGWYLEYQGKTGQMGLSSFENWELVQPASPPSPVRTKTVKEIVRGVYSGVHVCDVDKVGGVWVEIFGQRTASELREASRIFLELADALEA